MSAYAHQMERAYSAQSLSSSGDPGVDLGSRYALESGFFMTSFAATIFIGALVTVGVLLVTLLITLAVMLQSCQSRSKGVIEIQHSSDVYNCKILSLHAELNSLETDEFPPLCRNLAIQYIKEGQFAKDLNFTMWMVESYFNTITPVHDGSAVVLMDVDDLLASHPQYYNLSIHQFYQYRSSGCIEDAKHLKHMLTLQLYLKLRSRGWPLILLSRMPERLRSVVSNHLISAGYRGWSSLIMRLDDELQMDSHEYFSRRRAMMQKEGFHMVGVISSQMDALTGPCLGKRIFKLPNPIHHSYGNQIERWRLSQ